MKLEDIKKYIVETESLLQNDNSISIELIIEQIELFKNFISKEKEKSFAFLKNKNSDFEIKEWNDSLEIFLNYSHSFIISYKNGDLKNVLNFNDVSLNEFQFVKNSIDTFQNFLIQNQNNIVYFFELRDCHNEIIQLEMKTKEINLLNKKKFIINNIHTLFPNNFKQKRGLDSLYSISLDKFNKFTINTHKLSIIEENDISIRINYLKELLMSEDFEDDNLSDYSIKKLDKMIENAINSKYYKILSAKLFDFENERDNFLSLDEIQEFTKSEMSYLKSLGTGKNETHITIDNQSYKSFEEIKAKFLFQGNTSLTYSEAKELINTPIDQLYEKVLFQSNLNNF